MWEEEEYHSGEQFAKFSSVNFQKMVSPSYIILSSQRLEGKQCGSR